MANPFQKIATDLDKEQQDVRRAGAEAESVMDATSRTNQNLLQQRAAAARSYVSTVKSVTESTSRQAAELQTRVAPFQQQQLDAVSKIQRASNMNPIVRDLFGIFDTDYNLGYQQQRLRAAGLGVDLVSGQYNRLKATNDAVLSAAAKGYQAATVGFDVESAMATLNQEAAFKDYELQKAQLTDVRGQIDAMAALSLAEQRKRSQILASMDPMDINSMLAEASRSPSGSVTVDGINISTGELTDLSNSWQRKQIALESSQLALANGRHDLAASHAKALVNSMSESELNEVIGQGTYRGQPLDPDQNLGVRQMAVDALQNLASLTAKTKTLDESNLYLGTFLALQDAQTTQLGITFGQGDAPGRLTQMFGAAVPTSAKKLLTNYTGLLSTWTQLQQKAKETGVPLPADVTKAMVAQMNKFSDEYDSTIKDIAKQYGGDNSAMVNLAETYLTGGTLSSTAATEAVMEMVRTGVSPTTPMDPMTQAAYQAATQAQSAYWAEATGDQVDLSEMSSKEREAYIQSAVLGLTKRSGKTKAQIDSELQSRVAKAVASKYNNQAWQQIQLTFPEIASRVVLPDGSRHPFSRLPQAEWQWIINQADQEAVLRESQALSLNPQDGDLTKYLAGTVTPRLEAALASAGIDRRQLDADLAAFQRPALAKYLGSASIATRDFDPGAALVDLLKRPEFAQAVQNMTFGASNQSLPSFAFYAAGGGSIYGNIQRYTAQLEQDLVNQRSSQEKAIRERAALYGTDRQRRAETIIAAIGPKAGLNQQDVETFTAALPQILASSQNMQSADVRRAVTGAGTMGQNLRAAGSVWDFIDSALKSGKLEDPNLERIRKQVVKHWDEAAQYLDAAQARLAAGGQ